jgi:hypothetical protein
MDALVSIKRTIRFRRETRLGGVSRGKNGREKANARRHIIIQRKTKRKMFSKRVRFLNRGIEVRKNINELNVMRLRVWRRIICNIIGKVIAAIPARNIG